MSQMKEQHNYTKITKQNEASNLPDTKFKTVVRRMLNKLQRRIDELSDNLKIHKP